MDVDQLTRSVSAILSGPITRLEKSVINHRSVSTCITCMMALSTLSGPVVADVVYKITDRTGQVTYSGTAPTDGSAYEILKIPSTKLGTAAAKGSTAKPGTRTGPDSRTPKDAAITGSEPTPVDTSGDRESDGRVSSAAAETGPAGGGGGASSGGGSLAAGGAQTARTGGAEPGRTGSSMAVPNAKPPEPPAPQDQPEVPPPAIVESGSVTASCALDTYGVPEPEMVPPIVQVTDFGAKGDGLTDDSDAINRAIASMTHGGTLVFPPSNTYLQRRPIHVTQPGVRLWGYGAILYSFVTKRQRNTSNFLQFTVELSAPRTGVYGFTFTSNLRERGTNAKASLDLSSQGHEVVDNRFEYVGVHVRGQSPESGARDFVIARNVVYRSIADAIQVTTNSWDGRVLCNTVRENGDDMISVLDWGSGEPDEVGNILIEDNDLSGNYWGRGITVHGGRDVTIRGNTVAKTTHGAGIYINGGPDAYQMANVRNVLIENNTILQVQTTTPVYNPLPEWKRTGHGAIEIHGRQEVSDVLARNNRIQSTRYDGIRVRGNALRIGLVGNQFYDVHDSPIDVQSSSSSVSCADNRYNNAPTSHSGCRAAMPNGITGATM